VLLNEKGQKLEILYPGFAVSPSAPMDIQHELLLEQIGLLAKSKLGMKLLQGAKPRTIDEFREIAPLTTYSDYMPYYNG